MVEGTRHSSSAAGAPLRTTRLLHDLRNALAGLKLDASLLADDISASQDARARIMAYTDDLQQAIQLTNRISSELGVPGVCPEAFDPNEVLEGIAQMVDRTFPSSSPVELELEPAIWRVSVVPRLLHRALVNLVTRAQDSMVGGGMLHLASANRPISAAAAAEIAPEMPPGRYVRLSMGTLCGTAFDHHPLRDESFDGALEDMGGFSRIHNGPMMTTFELYLPAHDGADAVADLRCPDATGQGRGPRKV